MINVSPAVSTTYSVTVTDVKGCEASTSATVTVNPLPAATIMGDTELCVGETTRLTASGGTSYLWSNGVTAYWIDVTPAVSTTYTVTVTDGNGCQSSSSITVTVNPLPAAAIISDTEICNGESTTLTASGGTSYLWSNGSSASGINVSPSMSTTYTVTVTDGNGCQSSSSITVTVNPLPAATIMGDTEICNGESTTLTAGGGTIYSWSTGDTTGVITVNPSVNTAYGLTVTDGKGCTSTASVSVIVNALPIVGISGDTEICLESCTTLTATGGTLYEWEGLQSNGYSCNGPFFIGGLQGGGIASLYSVNGSNSLSLIGSTGTNNVNGIGYYCDGGTRPYIYGMKSLGNSITEAVRANLVRIDPRSGALTILGQIPQPPNPYGLTGTTGIMTYIGDVSAGGIYYFPAVAALINPFTFEIVDYTIYLGQIDLNNHGNGGNVTYAPITVLATCKPYLDACITAFQTYALNPAGREPSGGIQDWALSPDGTTLISFFGIENALFRLNVSDRTTSCLAGPASNGIYTGVTGVSTDEFGGIYYKDGQLYGHQVDRGKIFSINELTGQLTLVTEGLPTDYRGDSAICGPCGDPGTGPNTSPSVTVCPTETTIYNVKVTDDHGCMTTASITVTVNALPVVVITGEEEICSGSVTTLTASGGTSYVWSTGATGPVITVSPLSNTNYIVTVTDGNGCSASGSKTVVVNALPVPEIIGNRVICNGESTLLGVLGGVSYIWNTGATTTVINVSPSVSTTYSVTVTDVKGCEASTSATVTVNPLPAATIMGDTELCVGETTRLTASGGTSYLWSNGVTAYWIDVTPAVSTTYTVTVTDGNGCQSSSSITVTVNPLPAAAIIGDTEICNGESTTLTASGGDKLFVE
ncbi:MAG: hypothetical protein IPO92_21190 [Saprospiraceae bacterium]|nr:hypothetical protein [Saprospiraceae bacterium]